MVTLWFFGSAFFIRCSKSLNDFRIYIIFKSSLLCLVRLLTHPYCLSRARQNDIAGLLRPMDQTFPTPALRKTRHQNSSKMLSSFLFTFKSLNQVGWLFVTNVGQGSNFNSSPLWTYKLLLDSFLNSPIGLKCHPSCITGP